MDPDEQRRLADAARRGESEAWEALYRNVFARLRTYVARRVGQAATDDVLAETMARAVAGIHRFTWEPAGFDGWLFGIARNVCADTHRRSFRAVRLARRLLRTTEVDLEPAPGEALERVADHDEIRTHFAALPSKDRELLELRVIGGLSAQATASVLGMTPGAIRTAQSRALARLRLLMDGGRL